MSEETTGDLDAIVAELRRELDRLDEGRGPVPDASSDGLLALTRAMEATRGITADHPPMVRPGSLAPATRRVKRVLQRGLRWYVERLALDVRQFADAATRAVASTADRVLIAERRLAALAVEIERGRADAERGLAALRDRLGRLERAGVTVARPAPGPERASTDPPARSGPARSAVDYYAFEALMRGSRDEIRARQRAYLPVFADADDILDAGCGRGEFLELLREAGRRARGIDLDADMVEQCRAEGLEAERGDAIAHLQGLPAEALGGLFAAQVVEHLRPDSLVAFLAAARAALRPGAPIVLETINPGSLSALRNYFADLTHAQPLVPETLAFLVESAGFAEVRVEPTSPVPAEDRLARVPLGSSVPEEARAALDRDVDLLNALLFAHQDYAVIARA